MQTITTIGLDIAKSVFQVHGVDNDGKVVIRRQLKRRYVLAFFEKLPPCLVGIEACASSHHWSRELQALGHTVRLMPPAYVKPYVKRQKNDAADGEAICEAVTRTNMRFVPVKTPEQQSGLTLHRTRHLFIRHTTLRVGVRLDCRFCAATARTRRWIIISLAPSHHCPGHSGELVGKRDSGDFGRASCQQRCDPGPILGAVDLGIANDGECTGHEQAAQIAIPLFADTAEPIPTAARVLFGNQPDLGREVTDRKVLGSATLATRAVASQQTSVINAIRGSPCRVCVTAAADARHRGTDCGSSVREAEGRRHCHDGRRRREFVKAGGLLSYGPDYRALFLRAADYVDKILRGTKPGDIPVEQPTRFELVINLKTANRLGLTISA